jgi:ferredoxin-type protein NapH
VDSKVGLLGLVGKGAERMSTISLGSARARSGRRQSIRRALVLFSLLLFPVVLNYLSPYLIIDGAANGVVNGSFVVFGLLFLSALFVGRAWCGWACPGAGLQDAFAVVNGSRSPGGRWDWIKWAIWIPWVAAIAFAAASAGGYRTVDFFYMMDTPISVDRPMGYIMYYTVIGIFLLLALAIGKRAGCHYICWMAPFMILGRKLRNAFAWPSLRLKAYAAACGECGTCTKGCPMSLEVTRMVKSRAMEHPECILCGTCVDSCPKGAIRYSFSSGR